MHEFNCQDRSGDACVAGCSHCEVGGENVLRRQAESPLQGWRLALGASTVFWVPLLLAIVGAVVGNAHQVYQLTGAAAGFAVGTTVSRAIMKLVYPTDEEGAHG